MKRPSKSYSLHVSGLDADLHIDVATVQIDDVFQHLLDTLVLGVNEVELHKQLKESKTGGALDLEILLQDDTSDLFGFLNKERAVMKKQLKKTVIKDLAVAVGDLLNEVQQDLLLFLLFLQCV